MTSNADSEPARVGPSGLGPAARLALALSALSVPGAGGAVAAEPDPPRATVLKITSGGPQLAYERFRRRVQVEVAEQREAQISALDRLLELGTDPEEVPDLKFRLAELYADKARDFFFQGQEKDDAIIRADADGEKAALEAEKAELLQASKDWALKALKVYADTRANHPDYPRMPEVLFALGQAHWTAGEKEAALKPYAELIREYPKSPLVAEAWIAFGEYYFDEGDVRKALQSYEKAAEDKRSRVYGFALYKQGWCHYNLARWREALRAFETTVLYSQMSEELSGENKIALGREAEADWVRTYVHVGTSKKARFELMRLLGVDECAGRCVKLLEGLAGLWYEEGYFDASASVYRQVVELEPNSLRNPLRQGRIVDLADRMGDKKRTVRAAERLVEIFVAARARLEALPEDAEERLNGASDIEEASIVSETTLRRLAQEWNKEARKTRQDETFARAETMYAAYLSVFPEAEASYGMRFQYADLLYKLERFDEAAKTYRAVVEARPEDGEHLAEAANDNILAVEEHLRDLRLRLPEDATEPAPLHPQHQRLVDAADRYLALVSAKEAEATRPAVQLKAARVFYAYNQFPEALGRFEAIVKATPRSEQAVVAANLVVDVHNLRQDWTKLYEAARRYLDTPELLEGRPKLQKELERFGEYAKFALVQADYEQAKAGAADLASVARAFEDFSREFPRSDNADEALFNASVILDRVGAKERASELRQRLLERYPDSPLRADVAYYVAKRLQERTAYGPASKALLRFAREFPEDERARDALYDASVLLAGTGRSAAAAKVREQYLDRYRRSDDAEEVAFAIAADLERARRWRPALRAYAAFAKRHRGSPRRYDAMWREAKIRRRLRDRRGAEKLEDKIWVTVRWLSKRRKPIPPNASRYASLVAIRRLEDDRRDYERMRIERPSLRNPRPFRISLRAKARARDRLIRRYTAVVTDYKQAEASLAALHHIARAWDDFGRDLAGLPCPRGVSGEVCQELKSQLETLALPVQDSAIEAYSACVKEANVLSTYTAEAQACAARLVELAPDRAPPMPEKVLPADARPRPAPPSHRALILEPSAAPAAEVAAEAVATTAEERAP